MQLLTDQSTSQSNIESILPLDNALDAWGAELPAGMNPLGQSADYDWSNLSWYEMGAVSEAVLKMFSPAAIALDRVLTYVISDGVMAVSLQAIFQHLKIRKNVCTKTEIANAVTLIKHIDTKAENYKELAQQVNQRIMARNGIDMGIGFKPGQSLLVPAGMTATMETPNVPNQEFFNLDTVLFRELGALFWMSKELIQLNAETGNFSSIRMLMKAAEPGLRFFQNLLAYNFLRHWWSFALRDLMYEDAAIRRAINRLNYNPHFASWDYPGWKGLDPEKDFESDDGRMSNGHASDSSVFQERGLNFSKELPRIVGDAWWRMELALQEVVKPENKALLDKCGISTKEAFALLYGRTSPNGAKIVPLAFAQQPKDDAEDNKDKKKKEEQQESKKP